MADTQAQEVVRCIGATAMDCLSRSAAQDFFNGTGTKHIEIDMITQLLIMQTFAVEYPKHARRLIATCHAETQARMRMVADQIAESLS